MPEDSAAIQEAKVALQSGLDLVFCCRQLIRWVFGVPDVPDDVLLHFPTPPEPASGLLSPLHRGPWNLAQAWHQYHLVCANEARLRNTLQRIQARSAQAISDADRKQRQQRNTARRKTARNQAAEVGDRTEQQRNTLRRSEARNEAAETGDRKEQQRDTVRRSEARNEAAEAGDRKEQQRDTVWRTAARNEAAEAGDRKEQQRDTVRRTAARNEAAEAGDRSEQQRNTLRRTAARNEAAEVGGCEEQQRDTIRRSEARSQAAEAGDRKEQQRNTLRRTAARNEAAEAGDRKEQQRDTPARRAARRATRHEALQSAAADSVWALTSANPPDPAQLSEARYRVDQAVGLLYEHAGFEAVSQGPVTDAEKDLAIREYSTRAGPNCRLGKCAACGVYDVCDHSWSVSDRLVLHYPAFCRLEVSDEARENHLAIIKTITLYPSSS